MTISLRTAVAVPHSSARTRQSPKGSVLHHRRRVAALTLFLPDFELGAWAEEPVKGATIHGTAGAPHASSAAETKP